VYVVRATAWVVVLGSAGWIGGCSGGDPTAGQPTQAPSLTNAPPSGSGSAATSGTSGTSQGASSPSSAISDCIAACEGKWPAAATLGRAIDQCWSQSCSSTCQGIGTGGALGPDHGSCKTDVKTPSAACSTCTVQHCCAVWDACFSNADCVALNACSIACYK
jgi:hypothetical protein